MDQVSGPVRCLVDTLHSTYLLDREEMLALRMPRTGHTLRGDAEKLRLLTWPAVVVGEPMRLLLAGVSLEPTVLATVRVTAPVVRITDELEVGVWEERD